MGPDPLIDDDLANVAPWLANRCAVAVLRLQPADGHLSVLSGASAALEWLSEAARR